MLKLLWVFDCGKYEQMVIKVLLGILGGSACIVNCEACSAEIMSKLFGISGAVEEMRIKVKVKRFVELRTKD